MDHAPLPPRLCKARHLFVDTLQAVVLEEPDHLGSNPKVLDGGAGISEGTDNELVEDETFEAGIEGIIIEGAEDSKGAEAPELEEVLITRPLGAEA